MLVRIVPDIDSDLADDADIFSLGLDSVSVMLLLTEIEQQYSISLKSDEIPFDQFRTVAGIASLVAAASGE